MYLKVRQICLNRRGRGIQAGQANCNPPRGRPGSDLHDPPHLTDFPAALPAYVDFTIFRTAGFGGVHYESVCILPGPGA